MCKRKKIKTKIQRALPVPNINGLILVWIEGEREGRGKLYFTLFSMDVKFSYYNLENWPVSLQESFNYRERFLKISGNLESDRLTSCVKKCITLLARIKLDCKVFLKYVQMTVKLNSIKHSIYRRRGYLQQNASSLEISFATLEQRLFFSFMEKITEEIITSGSNICFKVA